MKPMDYAGNSHRVPSTQSYNCIGPQRGEPYCPCAMKARGVFKRDGRWIEPERDLGPVQNLRELWETMR